MAAEHKSKLFGKPKLSPESTSAEAFDLGSIDQLTGVAISMSAAG
jgi:hypothetical protein